MEKRDFIFYKQSWIFSNDNLNKSFALIEMFMVHVDSRLEFETEKILRN